MIQIKTNKIIFSTLKFAFVHYFATLAVVVLKMSEDIVMNVFGTGGQRKCFSFVSSHQPFFLLPVASGAASKTLVVNNLAFSATEEVLQSAFEKAVSIRIPQRDGRPKG